MVFIKSCQNSANVNILHTNSELLEVVAVEIRSMAAVMVLPGDEFFSENYMDAFFKAHVASSRTRGSGNVDEDIAAIEAEIRK